MSLVDSLYKTGEWDEALRQVALLLPELEATEQIWNLLFLRSLQAMLLTSRGDPAEAASFMPWVVRAGRENEVGWVRVFALLAGSAVHLQAGENEEALDLLTDCFTPPRAAISVVEVIPEAVRTALLLRRRRAGRPHRAAPRLSSAGIADSRWSST